MSLSAAIRMSPPPKRIPPCNVRDTATIYRPMAKYRSTVHWPDSMLTARPGADASISKAACMIWQRPSPRTRSSGTPFASNAREPVSGSLSARITSTRNIPSATCLIILAMMSVPSPSHCGSMAARILTRPLTPIFNARFLSMALTGNSVIWIATCN